MQGQKSSLDSIVADLASMHFIGRDRETASSVVPSPRETPAPDSTHDGDDVAEQAGAGTTIGGEEGEEKEEGEEDKISESGLVSEPVDGNDIEMGELEEDVKEIKIKKKAREDMEEGEATDASSELSEPPDDIE